MTEIKSLEDLGKMRDEYSGAMDARKGSRNNRDRVELMVGTATCGVAAGAKDVADALVDEAEKQGIDSIDVLEVGCIGFCYYEPIVQVNMPGEHPVFYRDVDVEKAREIIRKHVANGELLQHSIVNISFDRG